jgi:adenylate kinase
MTGRGPDLIMVGPPGSGKSTHAARLADRLGAVHVNPGRLLRELATEDSRLAEEVRDRLAEGRLIPDDVTDRLVRARLDAVPADQRVVLDGYPRTAAQADTLRGLLADRGRLDPRPVVLRLDVPEDELLDRLRHRRDVEGRRDDADDVMARRLRLYDAQAAPLLGALEDWADVVGIEGDRPVDAVSGEMVERGRGQAPGGGRNT